MLKHLSERALKMNQDLILRINQEAVKQGLRPAINIVDPEEIAVLVQRVIAAESDAARDRRRVELMRGEMCRNRRETDASREAYAALLKNYNEVLDKLNTVRNALA